MRESELPYLWIIGIIVGLGFLRNHLRIRPRGAKSIGCLRTSVQASVHDTNVGALPGRRDEPDGCPVWFRRQTRAWSRRRSTTRPGHSIRFHLSLQSDSIHVRRYPVYSRLVPTAKVELIAIPLADVRSATLESGGVSDVSLFYVTALYWKPNNVRYPVVSHQLETVESSTCSCSRSSRLDRSTSRLSSTFGFPRRPASDHDVNAVGVSTQL